MELLAHILRGASLVPLTTLVNVAILPASYGAIRFLHVSARKIAFYIGMLLLYVCGFVSILMLTNSVGADSFGLFALISNVLGIVSFFVAIYALGLWIVRGWYVAAKTGAGLALTQRLRGTLLFLREQHSFFGWVVLATATAHALYFLPVMTDLPFSEVIQKLSISTGLVAWGVLVFLVVLGLWIENARKRKCLARGAQVLHIVVALIFLGGFAVHFIFR